MIRRNILLVATSLFLAFFAQPASAAAGEPGPGLEILDAGSVGVFPAPDAPPPSPAPEMAAPYLSEPYPPDGSTPVPFQAQPAYAAPGEPAPSSVPAPAMESPYLSEPYSLDGSTPVPLQAQPEYAAPVPAPAPEDVQRQGEAQRQQEFAAAVSPQAVLESLDVGNPKYPGLGGAAAQGNLQAACDIILRTLRERRIVGAALAKGPGGSFGVPAPHESAFLSDMLYNADAASGTPLQAARRIDAILDAFGQPILDDAGFPAMMERAILRLHADLTAIRLVLADPPEDVVYHEFARTYIRAATICDFFVFPKNQIASDVNAVMASAETMFYPDGSSKGGDVGGVSGTAFKNLLTLDDYSYGDEWFRRRIASGWRILARPARFLQGVMLPDMTLPRYGPRGERELTPVDMAKLKVIFPEERPASVRSGLGATGSFPVRSGLMSYGGVYAMRSGSDAGARYLSVRFGPWGRFPGAPAHNDFGSLVVASGNITFVADPGGFGGGAEEAAAHSVLSLDGVHAEPAGYNVAGEPVDSVWRTNAALDYAADAASLGGGKIWQRNILYVKSLPGEGGSDYWVVFDNVDMNGDGAPHSARIRFQLAPGVQAYHDGSGMLMTTSYGDGPAMRIFAVDGNSQLALADGDAGVAPSYVYDAAGNQMAAPSVVLERTLTGDGATTTILYPGDTSSVRPARIERDTDIIRGRTGAIVIDHGMDKIDVVAWAPPGSELVTPTLSLQLSADVAVFRLRKGRIVRAAFVNLEHFQAKEPDGGEWSMRVRGPAATLLLEPDQYGGWQILSDPANAGAAWLENVNLGPAIANRRTRISPGELRAFGK